MRVIEAEIRNYHRTVQELRELEEAMSYPAVGGDFGERVQTAGLSDPTAARAFRMMTSAELIEIRRRVDAIEYMIRVLKAHPEPGRYELIRLRYWDGRYTVPGICDKLNIGQRTYYRWRRDALQLVAERLGWRI